MLFDQGIGATADHSVYLVDSPQSEARCCKPDSEGNAKGSLRLPAHAERLRQYERSSLRPTTFTETTSATMNDSPGPWSITRPSQLSDPECRNIMRQLEYTDHQIAGLKVGKLKYATEARNTHTIDFDGRLRRITPHGPRLVVPSVQRYELLRAYHVLP